MAVKKSNAATVQNEPKAAVESSFSKEQLLASKHFQDQKDIVNAILSPDGEYTVSAVKQMIENYMKGQVK